MKKRNMFVRIFAIVLCVLMALSAVIVGLSSWANAAEVTEPVVNTGSNEKPLVIIIAIVIVAVAAIAACIISGGKKKKSAPEKEADEEDK